MQQTAVLSFKNVEARVFSTGFMSQARSTSIVEKRVAASDSYDLMSNYGAFSRAKEMGVRSWHLDAHSIGLISDIKSIEGLSEDWDGEGASSIPREATQAGIGLIRALTGTMLVPSAYPNPNGTLTLYWSLCSGHAELEIGRTRFSWLTFSNTLSSARTVTGGGATENLLSIVNTALMPFIRAQSNRLDVSSIITLTMDHVWPEVA